jgi:transposase
MENRIKECQSDLFADRTSAATMRANVRPAPPRTRVALSLITAGIVHWNTVYLDRIVQHVRAQGVKLAFCWAHARRPFYEFYTSNQSPLAAEVLARIAKLYEIEAGIRGQPPNVRQAVRRLRSRPLVEDLHLWLEDHLPRLPGWTDLAKAMRYALRHWDGLIRYLDDGRLEMDTNVVERAIRPVTITRKNSLFAGSDAGARRWAIANTLIQSCKLNGIEPLAYLTDVLQRIVSARTKNNALHALLPWNWHSPSTIAAA